MRIWPKILASVSSNGGEDVGVEVDGKVDVTKGNSSLIEQQQGGSGQCYSQTLLGYKT